MPLKLNVGLSRKVGEANYGSRGASVNVELELDSALVGDANKLQDRIRQLFGIVRVSLAEELNGSINGNGAAQLAAQNGNGNAPPATAPRPATQSQLRAIKAIVSRQKVNLGHLLQERFHLASVENLSIRQASQLIDELKSNGHREGG